MKTGRHSVVSHEDSEVRLLKSPERAYWEFFRADRDKDANAWAAVMHYPHVRVAATGRTELFQNSDEYAGQATWTEREATGWVRTEGIEPSRIYESEDLVILNAGWTRMNANDEPILENRVVYVLSLIENSWGVQARFACGAMPRWHATDDAKPAELVSRFLSATCRHRLDDIVRTVQFPLVQVEVGKVEQFETPAELTQFLTLFPAQNDGIIDVKAIQNGPIGANVAATWCLESGQVAQGVFLIGKEPVDAILAMSLINRNN